MGADEARRPGVLGVLASDVGVDLPGRMMERPRFADAGERGEVGSVSGKTRTEGVWMKSKPRVAAVVAV